LENDLGKLKRSEKNIKAGDPFNSDQRLGENSLEEDVDEQIGHFDTEVKASFIKKQIAQVKRALIRLKDKKYGVCEKCGQMIDTDRLAVRPEVTICLKCEKEREEE